jgi:hypothetical protein
MLQQREKAPPNWSLVRTFSKTVGRTEVAVEIKRDLSVNWPKFSYTTGRQGQDKVIPHLSLESHKDDNGNREYVFISDTVADLVEQAENWIVEQTKQMDAAYAEYRNRSSSYSDNRSNSNPQPYVSQPLPADPKASFDDNRRRQRGNGSRRGRDFEDDRD